MVRVAAIGRGIVDRVGWISAVAAVMAIGASGAGAQTTATNEVVSTAPAKSAATSGASTPTTDAQIADWIRGSPPLSVADDSDGVINATPDRGIHGEVGAFVSNHGYGGYGAATMPIGKDATLGLAVGDTHYSGRYFRGDHQSLAASLAIGPQSPRPVGCPGSVQVGDRYVEPLWAARMRGPTPLDDAESCVSPAPGSR
jgi:hypothetical protein